MNNPLQNENPKERYLWRHPVHGQGWIDEDDYRIVNNYLYPHIRAKNTPRRIWPDNASDWGLQLWVPSQTDMTPGSRNTISGRPPRPHPVLVSHGRHEREAMDPSDVYAAFYYTIPSLPKCSLRRSCRFTHWTIDDDTEEIIMDDCWGCRRMNDHCSMRGYRVARKAIHGDLIIDGREKKLPSYGQIAKPPRWVPPRIPPGGGNGSGHGRHGGGGRPGGGIFGGGGSRGGGGGGGFDRRYKREDPDSDDETSDGGGSQGGDGEDRRRGHHGGGRGETYDDDGEEDNRGSPAGSSNGTPAESTQQSRRPDRKSGTQYRNYRGKSGHHHILQRARPGRSRPWTTPETPIRRKRPRATTTDDEDDDDGTGSPPGRRLSNHDLPQLKDLFREDSDDEMHYDLNLGTFDNGRRDANTTSNRFGSPDELSQNTREVSEPAVFPGVGRSMIQPPKEKGSTGIQLDDDPKEKEAVENGADIKEEEDEKPLVEKGSGNDEENNIEYLRTEYGGKGTKEDPWTFDA